LELILHGGKVSN